MARLLKRAAGNPWRNKACGRITFRKLFLQLCTAPFVWYVALLALACGVLLWTGDPSRSAWLPECLFHRMTGWLCYGCGSTRALHALLHANLTDSLRLNALLIPTLVWLGVLFLIRDKAVFGRVLAAGAGTLLAFTVLRNILAC